MWRTVLKNEEAKATERERERESRECDCKKDVCLRKDNSAQTHGAETRQMLTIPMHSKAFLVLEPCP